MTNEYEETEMPDVCGFLADGRRVYRFDGHRMVMTKEAHTAALSAAFAAEKEKRGRTPHQQSCGHVIDGQLCGGSLKMTPVCPKCTLGKHGVTSTLTCDVCGAVTAIMRGGK